MQQTLNPTLTESNWFTLSRCKGIFRYHLRTLGKTVAWVLGLLLVSGLVSALMPLLVKRMEYGSTGISANVGAAILFALICGCAVAGRSTRFLLRFGTPRFSAWLCNVIALMAGMLVLLLGTLVINTLVSYLVLALSQSSPGYTLWVVMGRGVSFDGTYLAGTLSQAIADFPRQMLWVVEYVSLFYLLGCCLRRAKGLTLTVVIGVPLVLMLLTVIPAVQQTIDIALSGTQGEMMAVGMQWMDWLAKAIDFLVEQWPTIQLILAVAALPLSYLCMRGTKQP